MSISTTIKSQIITHIQSCQSVQKVYGYEEINPSGWPAVFVTPADMEGEFASSAENSRVYAYRVTCLFPLGSDIQTTMNRLQYAEETLATVVDEIINAIDTDFELDGSPVLYTNAADVQWGEYTYEGGVAKAAQLTLRVYTEKVVA